MTGTKNVLPLATLLLVLCPVYVRAAWTADGVHVDAPNTAKRLEMTSDGTGGTILVWEDERDGAGNSDIFAQRVDTFGTVQWGNGVAICTAPFNQIEATIVSDGAGGAIIGWLDSRQYGNARSQIYMQRVNADGSVQWANDGVPVCTTFGNQYSLGMISVGAGGVIATWTDERSTNPISPDIFAQRVNLLGAAQWQADGVAVAQQLSVQNMIDHDNIVSDEQGGAIIVWTDYRYGNTADIYAQRINANGSTLWGSDGIFLSAPADGIHNSDPIAAPDGFGGAVVTWSVDPNGLEAQRIRSDGILLWFSDSAVVTDVNTSRRGITSDGVGGAIVTWGRTQTLGLFDPGSIYAQRFAGIDGSPQWASGGVALSSVDGSFQYDPVIVSDEGGAVIGFMDNSTYDRAFAQRIGPNGTVVWSPGGFAISSAFAGQSGRTIADGMNGTLHAWVSLLPQGIQVQRINNATGEWGQPGPLLVSVVDVPGDQGGLVKVRWNKGAAAPPWYYQVYRDDWGTWTPVGSAPYTGAATYNLNVPTLADSACNDPFGHQFMVSAVGPTIDDSNIGYGRSVDNLAPPAPVLTAQLVGNQVTLTWTNTAPDIMSWTVYLSPLPGVAACGTDCFFADVYDTTFSFEFGPPLGDMYWGVRAWDYHCNKGAMSNEAPILFPNTPVGNNVGVPLIDPVTGAPRGGVLFSQVTTEGRTDIEVTTSGPTLPANFATSDGKYYNVTTTATTTGTIEICINYQVAPPVQEASLRLFHYDTAAMPPDWFDITTILDVDNDKVCGVTTHLSPFVIGTVSATPVPNIPVPTAFALHPNVPNPFNPITTISYDVPTTGADVNISIYDVAGRLVRELVNGHRAAGRWSVQWNGDDDRGQRVASGVYFYRMRAGQFVDTKKMVLLK